jgi:hypothetical protein
MSIHAFFHIAIGCLVGVLLGCGDRTAPAQDGLVNEGLVKEGSVKEGSVKEGSVKEGSVKEGSVKEGLVSEGSVKKCPSTLPTIGASCTTTGTCDYFKAKSQCNYLDIYWHCSCGASGWSCTDDKEDCPCPTAPPTTGSVCAFPGPSVCDYTTGGGPKDGGPYGLKKCTCDGKTWQCVVYAG